MVNRMLLKNFSIIFAVVCLINVPTVFADTIHLKTGGNVTGKILETTAQETKVDVAGVTLTYYAEEIAGINSDSQVVQSSQKSTAHIQTIPNTSSPAPQANDSVKAVVVDQALDSASASNAASPAAHVNDQISKEEVKNVLERIEKAVNGRDLKAVKDLFWDDAVLSLKENDNGQEYQLALADYLNVIQKMWQQTQQYAFQYTLNDITVTGNRAVCHGIPQETLTTSDGKTIQSVADSEDGFEKRNGVVKKIYHHRTHSALSELNHSEVHEQTALQK